MAYDYSSRRICDDQYANVRNSTKSFTVSNLLDDLREKENNITKLKIQSGFITDVGLTQIIKCIDPYFLQNLTILDLSYTRMTAKLFENVGIMNNFTLLITRPNIKYIVLCGTYLYDDMSSLYSNLSIDQFEKIIWIHKEHISNFKWTEKIKLRSHDEIRRIIKSHKSYYDLKLKYLEEFTTVVDELKDKTKITTITDWNAFFHSKDFVIPEIDTPQFTYLILFALDDTDDDQDQCKLEIAKIYPNKIIHPIPYISANIYHALAHNTNVKGLIRGEAALLLADILQNADYDYNCDELYELAANCGYKEDTSRNRY